MHLVVNVVWEDQFAFSPTVPPVLVVVQLPDADQLAFAPTVPPEPVAVPPPYVDTVLIVGYFGNVYIRKMPPLLGH